MLRTLLIFFLLFGSALYAQSPSDPNMPTADENALHKAEGQMMEAAMANDADAFKAVADPEYRTVNEDGSAANLQETLAEIRSPWHLDITGEPVSSENDIRVIGNTGLITGRWNFMTKDNKERQIRYLEVWVKREGQWKFVQWQATRITPEGIEREKRMEDLVKAGAHAGAERP